MLSIGELSARSGYAVTTIRYYEARGLLPAAARVSGKRRFDQSALNRLHLIGAAQSAGFRLDEIARLFDGGESHHGLVHQRPAEVRAQIGRWERIARGLEQAAGCGCSGLEQCPIVLSVRPPSPTGS